MSTSLADVYLGDNKLSEEDKRPYPLEDASTNCAGRGLIAGLFGIPLAMFFAFFSISPETSSAPEIPGQPQASLWKRNVEVFKMTGIRGWQSGKNFFWLGLVWSGSECIIEKARGKSDTWNPVLAGVGTGMMLSWRGGAGPMVMTSASMAALAFLGDMAFGRGSHRPSSLFASE